MSISSRASQFLSQLGARTFAEKSIEPIKMVFSSFGDTNNKDMMKTAPLLIMHGFFGSRQNWKSICRVLQPLTYPLRRIITVDARNHGDSPWSKVQSTSAMAADVKYLMETEKINQIIFLGQSMGGLVGMHFAMQYPNLTESLIVLDTAPIPHVPGLKRHLKHLEYIADVKPPPTKSLGHARREMEKILAKRIPSTRLMRFMLANLTQKSDGTITWKFNGPVLKEYLENLVANTSFVDEEVTKLQKNFESLVKFSVSVDTGYKYLGPTMFMKGEKSNYIKKKDYANIKAIFPAAVIEEVKNAGHWIHYDKSLEFMRLIQDFINDPVSTTDDTGYDAYMSG